MNATLNRLTGGLAGFTIMFWGGFVELLIYNTVNEPFWYAFLATATVITAILTALNHSSYRVGALLVFAIFSGSEVVHYALAIESHRMTSLWNLGGIAITITFLTLGQYLLSSRIGSATERREELEADNDITTHS